ncbi:MAG: N-acetylmuramoyl-L-alanine amidase [Deltaproteobacteria bacterium]|nr:N-acetylmuramoyl-L-alanine amidase [Deltaproteobacteria bacterium]
MIKQFLAGLLVLIFATSIASAETFDAIKSDYLLLRNTDTEVTRTAEWQATANRFEQYAQKDLKKPHAASALYHAALIYSELFRKLETKFFLTRSLELFESVPRDYPGHELADDALVRLGNLQLFDKKDKKAARRSYQEVVYAYPDSDMFLVAKEKLNLLEHGKLPSRRIETKEKQKGIPLIVIDPGHGGEDTGAVGGDKLMEKDVVLDIGLRLSKLLEQDPSYQVRMTRRSDVFIPLKQRTEIANDFEADLFVSLHINASKSKSVTGIETYYLDNTNEQGSQKLAERENQFYASQGDGGDLNFILSDLIQSAKLDDSIALANQIQTELIKHMKTQWGKTVDLGVKRAPFYVLVGAHMPCVLVELYFINNRNDEKKLANSEFRQDLAEALYKGVARFIQTHKPS